VQGRSCVGRQGAGVEELLGAFDEVRGAHEAMTAEDFNDDGVYKGGINQVRGGEGGRGGSWAGRGTRVGR
jgi:hypothetical protein